MLRPTMASFPVTLTEISDFNFGPCVPSLSILTDVLPVPVQIAGIGAGHPIECDCGSDGHVQSRGAKASAGCGTGLQPCQSRRWEVSGSVVVRSRTVHFFTYFLTVPKKSAPYTLPWASMVTPSAMLEPLGYG